MRIITFKFLSKTHFFNLILVSFFCIFRSMKISNKDIYEFYDMRTICHIQSVKYFASLLHIDVKEHDEDKMCSPLRELYAPVIYRLYHPDFHISEEHMVLFQRQKTLHHKHAKHHFQHYKNFKDITDTYLYEMVADWAAANFEKKDILHQKNSTELTEWYKKNMSDKDWTALQKKQIENALNIIDTKTNNKTLGLIWQPLLEKANS